MPGAIQGRSLMWLLRFDPLSEKRAYEIKAILEERMVAKEGGER